jgi:hypothetical protein
MKGKVRSIFLNVCCLMAIVIMMPLMSAAITEITIKTTPNYRVSVAILSPEEVYSLIESFHTKADASGIAGVNYSSTLDEVKLGVTIRFASETVSYDAYGPYKTGEPIYIDTLTKEAFTGADATALLKPEEATTELINETELLINETIEIPENESESTFPTGKVVSVFKENKTIIIYVFVGTLILAGAIFLFIHIKKSGFGKSNNNSNIIIRKLSDIQKERENSSEEDQRMVELQAQISQAQHELNKIKNKDKIEELKKKLQKDKEELEDLERED